MKVIRLSNANVSDIPKDRFATSGTRNVCKYRVVFESTGEVFLPQDTSVFVEEDGSITSKLIQDCINDEDVLLEYYTVKRQPVPIYTLNATEGARAIPRGVRSIKRGLFKDKVVSIEKLEGYYPIYTLAYGEYLLVGNNITAARIFSSSFVFVEDLENS